jgi:hypothetical protein
MSWRPYNSALKVLFVLSGILGLLSSCTVQCLDCGGFPHGPIPPVILKKYNDVKGGVQITQINYNHDSNGFADEWLWLQTDSNRMIRGWSISAGFAEQRFVLSDSIHKFLASIYSHQLPDSMDKDAFNLHVPSGQWLWNKKPLDTAFLWDANGQVVDSLSYAP